MHYRTGTSIGARVAYVLIDGRQGILSIVVRIAIIWAEDSAGFIG